MQSQSFFPSYEHNPRSGRFALVVFHISKSMQQRDGFLIGEICRNAQQPFQQLFSLTHSICNFTSLFNSYKRKAPEQSPQGLSICVFSETLRHFRP